MKKRIWFVFLGFCLIFTGSMLYLTNSPRRIQLLVDGVPMKIKTRKIRTDAILKETGIPFSEIDRIFPRLNYWMTENYLLRVDHPSTVELMRQDEQISFISYENIAGNILLSGGVKLFPGDKILWNQTEIQADSLIGMESNIQLSITSQNFFKLVRDSWDSPQIRYTQALTVGEALQQLDVSIPQAALIFPERDTVFQNGMTIEICEPKILTISSNGIESQISACGKTVGEALSRAGVPLENLDYSIPSEDSPLPSDGKISVFRVYEDMSLTASALPNEIEWIPDNTKPLDSTGVIKEGHAGVKGVLTKIRYQDDVEISNVSEPETVLIEPEKAVHSYGTQIQTQTITTADGTFEYWRSIPVYATSYSPCRSGVDACLNGTSSGARVEKGIIAVSYDWYLKFGGQRVYIPGYGTGVIGDVGKSPTNDNRWVDLAYSDNDFVGWSDHTMLYFLTPVPTEIQWVL
jgi:uncharacterized protein YabE (DUF348 family)